MFSFEITWVYLILTVCSLCISVCLLLLVCAVVSLSVLCMPFIHVSSAEIMYLCERDHALYKSSFDFFFYLFLINRFIVLLGYRKSVSWERSAYIVEICTNPNIIFINKHESSCLIHTNPIWETVDRRIPNELFSSEYNIVHVFLRQHWHLAC